MTNLTNPSVLYAKGILFLLCGTLAAGMLFMDTPTVKTAVLLAVAVWSFCRSYYFAFYVIQHYVDHRFRFSGLCDFVRYCRTGRTSTCEVFRQSIDWRNQNEVPAADSVRRDAHH